MQTRTAPMLRSISMDEKAISVSCKGLLMLRPCCWSLRWGKVEKSMPTLSRRCVHLLRTQQHCHRKESLKISQSPSTKKEPNLHQYSFFWQRLVLVFFFFPPFSHSWMKDGWTMTEMIFWMTCTWTCWRSSTTRQCNLLPACFSRYCCSVVQWCQTFTLHSIFQYWAWLNTFSVLNDSQGKKTYCKIKILYGYPQTTSWGLNYF